MGIRPTFAPGSNQPYVITQTPPPAQLPLQATAPTPVNYQQPQPYYGQPAPMAVQAPARPSIAPYVAGGIGAVTAVVLVGVIAIGLLLAFAVSALAIAVVAVVLKGLLSDVQHRPRR